MNNNGMLVVVSAPSGCGKDTVFKEIRKKRNDIVESVSATTRKPREGEVEGVNYFFLSEDEFKDLIENTERFRARLSDCTTAVPTCEPKTEPYVRSNSIRVFRERAVQYYGTNSDSFTLYTDRNFLDIPTPIVVLFTI